MVVAVRVCPKCKSIYAEDIRFCGIDGEKLVEQSDDPLIGHTLGKYEITKRLGAGAMGVVYRARHSVLETEFAVKVLYGEHGANETVTKRFRREAQAVSKIKHPNVVSIVDFGIEDEGLSYLVMELVEGPTLQDLIRAEAPFDLARSKLIARHIAEGLAEAHHHGFVHRDLKPGNVIINQKRRGELAKILDFGLVTITDSESSQTRLTKTGHTVGTPAYMAPEQTRSSKVQPTADLYSLGVIIFEMLTGRLPFDGDTSDVLLRKCMEPAPSLKEFGDLGLLGDALIERDPAARPQTAQETVQFIDELLDQSGVSISGLHNSPLSSSSALARKSGSTPALSGASLRISSPLSETSAKVIPQAAPLADADALARTSPSQPTALGSSESSASAIPSPGLSGNGKLVPAIVIIATVLIAAFVFLNRPDEVSVPVTAKPLDIKNEPAPPSPAITKKVVAKPAPAISPTNETVSSNSGSEASQTNNPESPKPATKEVAPEAASPEKNVAQQKVTKAVAVEKKRDPKFTKKRDTARSTKKTTIAKQASGALSDKKSEPKTVAPAPKTVAPAPKPPVVAEKPKPTVASAPKMPPPKPGKLKIRGMTWWDVHVDGQKKYRHPSKPHVFSAGKYLIELHNFNCANSPIRKTITIKPGQKVQLKPKCQAQ